MKILFILLTTYSTFCFSKIVTDSFTIVGKVEVALNSFVKKQTETIYVINEVSNNPKGYKIILQTDNDIKTVVYDIKTVVYDNKKLSVSNGQVILTKVESQTESINQFKSLVFNTIPTLIQVSIVSP